MKFKGRNGGMALAVRNHIMMFRAFAVSLLVMLAPTAVLAFMSSPYFCFFLLMPLMLLIVSFAVFIPVKYDEKVFLSGVKKDHVFEIKNGVLYKDGKEIKSLKSVKIYRYKRFLYIETSRTAFTVENADFVSGDRESFLEWARAFRIKVILGY